LSAVACLYAVAAAVVLVIWVPGGDSYESARTADKFLEFLKKKLEEDKGFARVAELDKLAQKFVAAEKKVCVCVCVCFVSCHAPAALWMCHRLI